MNKYLVSIIVDGHEEGFVIEADDEGTASDFAFEEADEYVRSELVDYDGSNYDGCPNPKTDPNGYDEFVAELIGSIVSVQEVD